MFKAFLLYCFTFMVGTNIVQGNGKVSYPVGRVSNLRRSARNRPGAVSSL